jgi:hypothetical protein
MIPQELQAQLIPYGITDYGEVALREALEQKIEISYKLITIVVCCSQILLSLVNGNRDDKSSFISTILAKKSTQEVQQRKEPLAICCVPCAREKFTAPPLLRPI